MKVHNDYLVHNENSGSQAADQVGPIMALKMVKFFIIEKKKGQI